MQGKFHVFYYAVNADISMNRPTHLFVLPWSLVHLGGVNQVVLNLAREMTKSGVLEPLVLISDWSATRPVWEVVHGIQTVRWRIRPSNRDMSLKSRLLFRLWQFRFRAQFWQFCRKHRVVTVNPHYPGPFAFTLAGVVDSLPSGIPLIFSFHGTDVLAIRSSSDLEKAGWRQLLLVHEVVVCSADLGSRLMEMFGPGIAPSVIYNGIAAAEFVATAGRSEPGAGRTILNVGRFDQNKGQDDLIRAFTQIADDFPDVKLVLVGARDVALPALQELSRQMGIEDRVHFFPDTPHADVADFFRLATIFCLSSRQEAFPIVLLEAGAFALPVTSTRVGGVPELLDDGVTGSLVAADDPGALALSLRAQLTSSLGAQQMGARLRDHVQSNFTWAAAQEKYAALVQPGWTASAK